MSIDSDSRSVINSDTLTVSALSEFFDNSLGLTDTVPQPAATPVHSACSDDTAAAGSHLENFRGSPQSFPLSRAVSIYSTSLQSATAPADSAASPSAIPADIVQAVQDFDLMHEQVLDQLRSHSRLSIMAASGVSIADL